MCNFSIVSTPMDPFSISFLAQFPCSGWNELVGREHHHGPSDYEYLRVSADFEFDDNGTGGRYRTYWETTGLETTAVPTALIFTGFDGEYISGELSAGLPMRWRDGVVPRESITVKFTASFRAKITQ